MNLPEAQPVAMPGSEAQPPVGIQVHRGNGKVVIQFDRELQWIAMAPADAKKLADAIKIQSMILGK